MTRINREMVQIFFFSPKSNCPLLLNSLLLNKQSICSYVIDNRGCPHQYKILLSQVSYQFQSAFNRDGIGFFLEEELGGDVCNPIGWRRFKVCIVELMTLAQRGMARKALKEARAMEQGIRLSFLPIYISNNGRTKRGIIKPTNAFLMFVWIEGRQGE